MKEKILETLSELRAYAVEKGYDIELVYHEEDSYLMRFANSAISLNTNEHIIRLDITANEDRKRASYNLITDLSHMDEMKHGIDIAAEMVKHAQPLSYSPTIPVYTETFIDESGFDASLAQISNEERLAYFNKVAGSLETEDLRLSGIFSNGANTYAITNTRSQHSLYMKTSDAQVSTVLAHTKLKWEVTAEQSAQNKTELDPLALNRELALLVHHYENDEAIQLPLGTYDIVMGSAALADFLTYFKYIAFDGGLMKRGFSFMREENIGQKVFSDKFTLVDDTDDLRTFPLKRDFNGMVRKPYTIYEKGVFKGFVWSQDDADEFGAKATGHSVPHYSLSMHGGDQDVATLEDLLKMPRDNDILYFPFLHYAGIVNPPKGIITGSSRFGALLLKKDGTVQVPYNYRLTISMFDLFGDKVQWMSKQTTAYNLSSSYGSRNPMATVVPNFMRINGLEISHSNSSY